MRVRAALGALAVGACGGSVQGRNADSGAPAYVQNAGGNIDFVPSSVKAERDPSTCGSGPLPFSAGDRFFLVADGKPADVISTELVVSFYVPVEFPVEAPVVLSVGPYQQNGTKIYASDGGFELRSDQTADTDTGNLSLAFTQGDDRTEIDTGPFDAATVSILKVPAVEGEPLSARIYVHFVDGNVLDETFSAPLKSNAAFCPAG